MKYTPLLLALVLPLSVQAAVNIQRWTTPQGVQVLLAERHENPIIDMAVSFRGAGNASDPDGKSETAAFTAALLPGGTKEMDEETFNAQTNGLAVEIGSSADNETATATLRSLSRPDTLKKAVSLFNGALTRPRFDEAVFRRNQTQAATFLQQQETKPDFTAARTLARLSYPDHPYGKGAYTTVQSINGITLDDIRAFYRTRYGKNNAVVAIVGDIDRKGADRLVQDALSGLPDRAAASADVPPVKKHPAQRRDIPFAGEQAQIMLGMPLITRNDPDYYALVVGNYVLGGGGFDSRLMEVLRNQRGDTYGVYSNLTPERQAGMFTIAYSSRKPAARASLAAAQEVIRQFIAEGPTEEEMAQAKANITGSFPLRFDSNAKLLGYLNLIGVYNLPEDYLEAYPKAVAKLTAADVKAAWQKRVRPEDLNIVVVGAQ
jgi:peptidase, M16 family